MSLLVKGQGAHYRLLRNREDNTGQADDEEKLRSLATAPSTLYVQYRYVEVKPLRLAVGKWGNSLAIRLPKELARELNLEHGSPVEITSNDQELIIRRACGQYSLVDLVSKITVANCHAEIPTTPVGREVW